MIRVKTTTINIAIPHSTAALKALPGRGALQHRKRGSVPLVVRGSLIAKLLEHTIFPTGEKGHRYKCGSEEPGS